MDLVVKKATPEGTSCLAVNKGGVTDKGCTIPGEFCDKVTIPYQAYCRYAFNNPHDTIVLGHVLFES